MKSASSDSVILSGGGGGGGLGAARRCWRRLQQQQQQQQQQQRRLACRRNVAREHQASLRQRCRVLAPEEEIEASRDRACSRRKSPAQSAAPARVERGSSSSSSSSSSNSNSSSILQEAEHSQP